MKKILFLILVLVSRTAVTAENNVPQELDIYRESAGGVPEYLTHFYPLGFSERHSYFAYVLYRNVSGGIGYYTYFELNIQNIVTDGIESRLVYDGRYRVDPNKGSYTELYKSDPEDGYLEFATVWHHVSRDTEKLLKDYNIIRSENPELRSFPYTSKNGDSYVVNIETFGNVADNFRYNSYKVVLEKSGEEKKTIFNNQDCGAMAVTAAGLIESPYENRVVVILYETIRGFEGPPNDLRPVTIGSHLAYGF